MSAPDQDKPQRGIRSYVLRQGRLTTGQQNALDRHWGDFGVDFTEESLDLAEIFGNDHPVTLEIGFGNGESLITQAASEPGRNFLGIEVHRPGVGHCLHLAVESQLANLRLSNHDATEVLGQQIADASIDTLQLFFPDPWHKKRHHKRRILQPAFIDTVHRKLIHGGRLHLATDWQDYAEHMQLEMDAVADRFELVSTDRGDRPMTKFEQRGLRLGHGVWDFVYQAL